MEALATKADSNVSALELLDSLQDEVSGKNNKKRQQTKETLRGNDATVMRPRVIRTVEVDEDKNGDDFESNSFFPPFGDEMPANRR